MICKLAIKNYRAFAEEVELDFYANGNIKRLSYNYISGKRNILKTAGIYGPNNTGKTCIFLSFFDLAALMKNAPHEKFANAFASMGNVTSFRVEYCVQGRFYEYSVSYDNQSKEYVEERLSSLSYEEGSVTKERIFDRTPSSLTWNGISGALKKANVANLFSLSFPFMLLYNDPGNETMNQAKKDYLDFANSISPLQMESSIDVSKTIKLLQEDPKAAKFIKEFVKNCDLHIDDFGFDEEVVSDADISDEINAAVNDPSFVKQALKFYSKHNGYRVPTIFFDSVGTKKIIALAGYVYEALRKGNVLVVDEIDSSLHHILTKSIVAMFNNMLNAKAQLIFTTHDALLLDLKEMFRKDQIWLVDVQSPCSSTIVRMSDRFTARDPNGIRGDEDVTDYYLKGQFGAIPTPDLFSSLQEAVADE